MNIDLQSREIKPLRATFTHLRKYVGDDKPASRYQEATIGVQSSANFHYRPTWDPEHELYDASRSAVVLADWNVLRDPRQFYYATWTTTRARQQDAVEANYQFVESRGLVGIRAAHHLPGVGRNFQDHILVGGCVWEYPTALPPQNNLAEATLFCKSDSSLRTPDLQPVQVEVPYASEVNGPRFSPPAGAWTLLPGLVRPKSRGRVMLASSNPKDLARVDSGFLTHADDVKALLRAVEICREIGNSAPMRDFVKREVMPGVQTKAQLTAFVRDGASTYFHQSCTCKMGRDAMSVVDGKLNVRGIERLSIADASVMPRVTTGNTMAPTVIIGERMADMLLGA